MKITEASTQCPRCSADLLTIPGIITSWLTCPKCKYTKLIEKERGKPKITPLLESSKPLTKF